MALPITGVVGIPASPQNSGSLAPSLGRFGELLTDGAFGKYGELVRRGYGFAYSTALAGNALIAAGTANAPLIANFAGSGVDLIILKVVAVRTAVGTPLEGGIVYLREAATIGAAAATGSPIVSGTVVAARNLRGAVGGRAQATTFYPTTVTATSGALTYHSNSAFAQSADDGATTVSGPRAEMLVDNLDGLMVVPEGGAFALGASVSLNTTYAFTIFGLEIPNA